MLKPDDDKTQAVTVLSKGTVINHYRIIEKIGAGGMGEVYLAEDTELNRKVALKFLSPHLCQDADCRARFKREAQAAAKLNHPNIVTIHEVSEHNGRPFFAMELVEGQPLGELIKQGDCSFDKVIDLSLQICEGLQEAHKAGITHRDIKPANILVSQTGRAKLVDFGLASVAGADKLTKEGSTLGTIGYMSPEQVQGKPTDHRSDLFSFGVVLYELISCKSPFKGETAAATMNAIAQQTPDPLVRYKTGVPDELQRIVSKLLRKDPALRYQTAADVISDLMGSLTHIPAKKNRTRRILVGAAALVLLAVAAFGIFKSRIFTSEQPTAQRKMLAVLPFETLGSSDDEYFADGITDEITGKLATIRDLGVISRTSTMQYKKTTKNLRQIAKELGVDYILEGSIRWEKSGDTNRVRILPQLIRVSDDTHLWVETYERPMTGVFAVQADIATQIVAAMNLTLRAPEVAALSEMSTENVEAYQAYLRGVDYFYSPDYTLARGQLAVQMFERAVRLDSTFVPAYAYLGMAHAMIYGFGFDASESRLAQAKLATDRALALQPNSPLAHQALSTYYYWGFRDYEQTLRELQYAEVGIPNDVRIISRKAFIYARQGRSREALEDARRAVVLDPRDAGLVRELADMYNWVHEYDLADRHYDQSIAIAPDQVLVYVYKALNYYMWRGDTTAARATLAAIPDQDAEDTRLAWVLQHIIERDYSAALASLTSMRSSARFWMWSGVIYKLQNTPELARQCFDSAKVIMEKRLEERPDDFKGHGDLGIIYAGLGRKDDAIRAGERAVKLLPVAKDAYNGPESVGNLALIYVDVGDYDAALNQIECLLSIPNYILSVSLLRLDPRYDPLRNLPRYQKLLEKYGT